jgi:tetratricopeptide (TPR) repeat protein
VTGKQHERFAALRQKRWSTRKTWVPTGSAFQHAGKRATRNETERHLAMAAEYRYRGGLLVPMAVAACVMATGVLLAQTAPEPSDACFNEAESNGTESTAQRIAACTRVIEAVKDAATRAQAYLQRGVLRELGGESETAVRDYTEAIKLDPANPLAYFNRGNAQDQLGQFELAVADYSQAIKLDPNEPDYFNNRGQAYDHNGQHDRAIADYSEAVRLDPSDARPLYNRGFAYANKSDYRRAIADFDQAIRLSPDDADLYIARGAAHEEVGEVDAAKADFGKALEIEPESEDAREGLSRLGG